VRQLPWTKRRSGSSLKVIKPKIIYIRKVSPKHIGSLASAEGNGVGEKQPQTQTAANGQIEHRTDREDFHASDSTVRLNLDHAFDATHAEEEMARLIISMRSMIMKPKKLDSEEAQYMRNYYLKKSRPETNRRFFRTN